MTKDRKPTREKLRKFIDLRNKSDMQSNLQFAIDADEAGFDVSALGEPVRGSNSKGDYYLWDTPVGILKEQHGKLKLHIPPGRWIITRDYIHKPDPNYPDEKSAVGVASRYYEDGEDLPHKFRMLDDDGHVYYHGKCSSCDDEHAFAPLEDFGTPNAGCTEIQYKNAKGEWETL